MIPKLDRELIEYPTQGLDFIQGFIAVHEVIIAIKYDSVLTLKTKEAPF